MRKLISIIYFLFPVKCSISFSGLNIQLSVNSYLNFYTNIVKYVCCLYYLYVTYISLRIYANTL